MSVKLIANKVFSHNGRALKKGESFVATDRDGRILVAIGRARHDDSKPDAALVKPPAYPSYQTRMMTAGVNAVSVLATETKEEPAKEPTTDEAKTPVRRQYTRRAMTVVPEEPPKEAEAPKEVVEPSAE